MTNVASKSAVARVGSLTSRLSLLVLLGGEWLVGNALTGCGPRHRAITIAPPTDHVIEVPPGDRAAPQEHTHSIEAPALVHVMRALYFLTANKPAAAIPHLRMALIYDPASAFIYERLTQAWASAGHANKARDVLARGLEAAPENPWLNALAGADALSQQQYERALEYFERCGTNVDVAAHTAPQWVESLLWLGRPEDAWHRASQVLEAISDGRQTDLAIALGFVFEDHGRLSWARSLYEKVRQLRPSEPMAAYSEARVLDLRGDPQAAAEVLRSLRPYFVDDLQLVLDVARLQTRAATGDAADTRLEALHMASDDPDSMALVALGDLQAGRRKAAMQVLKQALQVDEQALAPRFTLAKVYFQDDAPKDCVLLLGEVKSLPLPALALRARCYGAMGDLDRAFSDYFQWLQEGTELSQVLVEVAEMLAGAAREYGTAAARFSAFLQKLRIPPDHLATVFAWTTIDDYFGRGEAALQRLNAVAGQLGESLEWQLRMADLLSHAGDSSKALAILEEVLSANPQDPIRLNALGYTLAELDTRLAEASVYLRRAYRLAGEQSFIVDSLGWLLYRQGQPEQAAALLRRAAWASPRDAEVLLHLGDVEHALGNAEAANEAYARALRLQPAVLLKRALEERLLQGAKQ